MNNVTFTDRFTPGNPKRKRNYDPEWFKQISLKAYTNTEWTERFKQMTVKEQFDFIKVFVPKEVKVDSESVFTLQIEGLAPKVIQAQVIEQLIEHEDLNDNGLDDNK